MLQCNLCESTKIRLLIKNDESFHGNVTDVGKCATCGLVFRMYPDGHHLNGTGDNSGQTNCLSECPAKLSSARLEILNQCAKEIERFRKNNRILDVGSGYGYYLKMCRENGWSVWGIEKNKELVEFAKSEYQVDIVNDTYEKVGFRNGFFDAITFINSIEHFTDPYGALKNARDQLRTGGGILLRFPNGDVHVPMHRLFQFAKKYFRSLTKRGSDFVIYRYSFSAMCIDRCLQEIGFADIKISNSSSQYKRYASVSDRMIGPTSRGRRMSRVVEMLSRRDIFLGSSLIVTATKS